MKNIITQWICQKNGRSWRRIHIIHTMYKVTYINRIQLRRDKQGSSNRQCQINFSCPCGNTIEYFLMRLENTAHSMHIMLAVCAHLFTAHVCKNVNDTVNCAFLCPIHLCNFQCYSKCYFSPNYITKDFSTTPTTGHGSRYVRFSSETVLCI